jgi:nucleoside-diphosphate-sugar epimerase
MRILIIGAAGVLGRALIPHLAGHEVVGTTRDPARCATLEALGAVAVMCDVYETDALERVAHAARPEAVVNFLTDLSGGSREANARIRREAGPVVVRAAREAGARRLVVESIAFPVSGEGAAALAELEESARSSQLDALILRFGRLWGPGTWSESAPAEAPTVHVAEAGRRAASLILTAPPGAYDLVD